MEAVLLRAKKTIQTDRMAVVTGMVWLLCIAVGAKVLLGYANTPGRLAEPPISRPEGAVTQQQAKARLIVFIHPRCPCSRATLSELARIMAVAQGRLDVDVFFPAPRSAAHDWVRSELWRDASAIPGVRALEDNDGKQAARFQAFTSGQSMLYNAHGQLLFKGGITIARGHEGDNDGADAILSLLRTGTSNHSTTPVFGCSLADRPRL